MFLPTSTLTSQISSVLTSFLKERGLRDGLRLTGRSLAYGTFLDMLITYFSLAYGTFLDSLRDVP